MTPDRVAFWKDFILHRCGYPAPDRLRAQLDAAKSSEFCDCGCNSFAVEIPSSLNLAPLATKGGRGGAIFDVAFQMRGDKKDLEIILIVNEDGYLSDVEINCCGNSYPVPEIIDVVEPPFHVHFSDALLP